MPIKISPDTLRHRSFMPNSLYFRVCDTSASIALSSPVLKGCLVLFTQALPEVCRSFMGLRQHEGEAVANAPRSILVTKGQEQYDEIRRKR
jgi:hypothetical protein